ncbi:MAG TPA: fumarylacetoacetate hydrolase family protein [Nocardioidaceae bacterium]|nr:fumarylacetoacetate hydrolase family protein [Nocardioidaceae bacterium]
MHIVRYLPSDPSLGPKVGVLRENGSLRRLRARSIAELLTTSRGDIRAATAHTRPEPPGFVLLPPVDGLTEVWAAGVTYHISREARVEESAIGDVYDRVYEADRPEIFFKSVAWRVVGDDEPIGIRSDSELNVPEPELGLVLNKGGEVVGYTVANDVSSRSIEGFNPLYLAQAKIYAGACALGPGIRPEWEVEDATDLGISVEVVREGTRSWSGMTRTSLMHRTFSELVDHLFRATTFPEGAVLLTGTGLVPDMTFSLSAGDAVRVSIEEVGVLANTVAVGAKSFGWLDESANDPSARVSHLRAKGAP